MTPSTPYEKYLIELIMQLLEKLDRIENRIEVLEGFTSQTLTLEQAAKNLGLEPSTLKNYANEGKIASFKPGVGNPAKRYFDRDVLENYKRQNPSAGDSEQESKAATYNFLKRKTA